MQMDTQTSKREHYIDNLRLVMIVLVVIVHTVVTYSGIGGWYYFEIVPLDNLSMVSSALFLSFTQGYFMGFLFLISGYFAAKSYTRKSKKDFINSRLYRLGLPVVVFVLFIHPLTVYLMIASNKLEKLEENLFLAYKEYLVSGRLIEETGPLWFALALLVFSMVYVIIGKKEKREARKLPSMGITILAIIIIGTTSFLIRLVWPIDTSFLNMQLCFFAPYIALFIIGIKSYRYDWFRRLSYNYSKKWLVGTIVIGIISWVAFIILGGALEHGLDVYKGGLSWQSYIYAIWEAFISFGMSIGLLGLFREKYNEENKFLKVLSRNSFSVYVWHTPILVGISLLMRNVVMYPLVKMIVVASITLPICFVLSHYVFSRVPLLKKIM